jgi:hypothetical protein
MAAERHSTPRTKRVVLPSGKEIEVVYFERRGDAPTALAPRRLHICPTCDSRLVHPTDWSQAGSDHWHVGLRCPDCDWIGDGLYTQDEVDDYDRELDDASESILEDLKRLIRSNMEDEVDRFSAALEHDLILPEDF